MRAEARLGDVEQAFRQATGERRAALLKTLLGAGAATTAGVGTGVAIGLPSGIAAGKRSNTRESTKQAMLKLAGTKQAEGFMRDMHAGSRAFQTQLNAPYILRRTARRVYGKPYDELSPDELNHVHGLLADFDSEYSSQTGLKGFFSPLKSMTKGLGKKKEAQDPSNDPISGVKSPSMKRRQAQRLGNYTDPWAAGDTWRSKRQQPGGLRNEPIPERHKSTSPAGTGPEGHRPALRPLGQTAPQSAPTRGRLQSPPGDYGRIMGRSKRETLRMQEKTSQVPGAAAVEAVANAWSRLPAPVKGAIIGAPVGAVTTGAGEALLNRRLADGSTAQQHMYGSMADRARRMRDASEDPGLVRKLLAESSGYAENLADVTAEHPVKSALIAALLGSALGAGAGAATGATLRMLPQAASAVR